MSAMNDVTTAELIEVDGGFMRYNQDFICPEDTVSSDGHRYNPVVGC